MTDFQWNTFCQFREEFKSQCKIWSQFSSELIPLQKSSCQKDTPEYPIETPVVYNTALDDITADSDIKLIVIGDNPGKNEQLSINQKYLVGQAGKIAQGFFRNHLELQIDFRKNVIILNKTPIHSAKTKHLTAIEKGLLTGNSKAQRLIKDSQSWMATKTAELHQKLVESSPKNSFIPELWLVGYSELKQKGIFLPYRDTLLASYKISVSEFSAAWKKVFTYQHFSMNRFSIDLTAFLKNHSDLSLKQALELLGTIHKNEIFL